MADANDNGKQGKGPEMPRELKPEDILHQVTVVLTKDGETALLAPTDNLPLTLHLLAAGMDIAADLVSQALPKRIIPVTGPLPPQPPGAIPFGRAGG
jgi:hypothetical protein